MPVFTRLDEKSLMTRKKSSLKKATPPSGHCDAAPKEDRKAVAVEPDLKAANLIRLKRTAGQVQGIVRMVEADRYCADVIIQIAAAQESLRAVAKNLLKNHLKHCARAALKAGAAEADAMCNELMDVMSKIAR